MIEGHVYLVGAIHFSPFDFSHYFLEGLKVLNHCLVNQDISIRKVEYLFSVPGLPQAVDNLEGGIRFAGSRSHYQEDTILPPGYGIDSPVDGDPLVVSRCFFTLSVVIWLGYEVFLLGGIPFFSGIPLPKLIGAGEVL
jgi:hypothetical protein